MIQYLDDQWEIREIHFDGCFLFGYMSDERRGHLGVCTTYEISATSSCTIEAIPPSTSCRPPMSHQLSSDQDLREPSVFV
jgi:hypothetical protein